MNTYKYYYLEEESGYTVVTSIARGGSKAGRITGYEHKALKKPYLFTTKEEAQNTIDESEGMSYYFRDGDGKKHDCFMTWVIKEIKIEI
jgi:hypothetical protein